MLIFTYCLKILYKLSTLHDPAWDTAIAKATVDIVRLIHQCADAAERGNADMKQQNGEDSVLALAAEMMRATAPNWRVPEHSDVAAGSAMMSSWSAGEFDMSIMDLSEDFWLQGAF